MSESEGSWILVTIQIGNREYSGNFKIDADANDVGIVVANTILNDRSPEAFQYRYYPLPLVSE